MAIRLHHQINANSNFFQLAMIGFTGKMVARLLSKC